jgi:hypothetical protein
MTEAPNPTLRIHPITTISSPTVLDATSRSKEKLFLKMWRLHGQLLCRTLNQNKRAVIFMRMEDPWAFHMALAKSSLWLGIFIGGWD